MNDLGVKISLITRYMPRREIHIETFPYEDGGQIVHGGVYINIDEGARRIHNKPFSHTARVFRQFLRSFFTEVEKSYLAPITNQDELIQIIENPTWDESFVSESVKIYGVPPRPLDFNTAGSMYSDSSTEVSESEDSGNGTMSDEESVSSSLENQDV